MKYRYYKVTVVVAVAQYGAEDLCDEHAHLLESATPLGNRTALDAVDLLNDGEDYLLELSEEELHLAPKPRIAVINEGQGPLTAKKKR